MIIEDLKNNNPAAKWVCCRKFENDFFAIGTVLGYLTQKNVFTLFLDPYRCTL